jgi:phosphatidylserine/phosphatidylglycerophosphate/cardiolipin synthase-like enzyme
MDIDQLFRMPFHQSHQQVGDEIEKWSLKEIRRFPRTEFIVKGDEFFRTVWKMIDTAQEYFWITTYAMDSSPAADTTLLKLI